MKVLFVEARSKKRFNEKCLDETKKIKGKIFLAFSIQYKSIAEEIKKRLKGKIIGFSQVLGCTRLKTKADAILLVGSGRFHGLQIALSSDKEVFVLEGDKIRKIEKIEIETFKKKRRAALMKFYSAEKVGIIVSTKLGQENMSGALKLRDKLNKRGRDARIFLTDNIDAKEFENFEIESWVNTACSGIALDASILNYEDI